jgi:hypothetical protein
MTTEQDNAAVDETVGDDNAAAIWDEIEAEEGQSSDTPSSPEDRKDDDASTDEGEADTGDKPDEPEPEAKTEAPAAKAPAEQKTKDPWAAAPPEIRAEFDRIARERADLELKLKRETGRTSQLTRKLNELAPPPAPASPEVAAERNKRLATLREEYPEVATPLLEVIEEQQQQVAALTQAVTSQQESKAASQAEDLRKVHPDYAEIIAQDPDRFDAWVRDQNHPAWVLPAYERNGQRIVEAEPVIKILNEYKRYLGLPLPGSQPPARKQEQTGSTTSLADKRKRQLEGSFNPSGGRSQVGSSDAVPDEGDPEEIWEAIERQEEKQRARRR